jgi:hypothetical protein
MRRIAALLPPEYRGVYAEPAPTPVAAPTADPRPDLGGDPLDASRAMDELSDGHDEQAPMA